MIHTKLLIRRLAYVPWLLAFGLVLGWAGEAAAQTPITLTLDKDEVREDVTAPYTITAKATVTADAAADIYVNLAFNSGQAGLYDRFRLTLSTITIPKGAKEGTAALAFTPTNDNLRGGNYIDDGTSDDLPIVLIGSAGSGYPVNASASPAGSVSFTLIDDDKKSTTATLSVDPKSLSKAAGDSPVKVMAELNGSMSRNAESFPLIFVPASVYDQDGDGTIEPTFAANADSVLTRDAHYDATPTSLRIGKRKNKGEVTISIDPKDQDGYIGVTGEVDGANAVMFEGVDLNGDGDTGDSFTIAANGVLTEAALGIDIENNTTPDLGQEADEGVLNIDLDGDGTYNGYRPTAETIIKESELKFSVNITTAKLKITTAALANVKGDGLTATRDMIREDTGSRLSP